MQAFITDADLASAMVAAAASLRRRRLSSLSISSVQQPVTQLGAEVTIVIQQLAAEAGAYEAVSDSHMRLLWPLPPSWTPQASGRLWLPPVPLCMGWSWPSQPSK